MTYIKSFHSAPHSLVQSAVAAQLRATTPFLGIAAMNEQLQQVTEILETLPHPRLGSEGPIRTSSSPLGITNPLSGVCLNLMLRYAWARLRGDNATATEIQNEFEKSSCGAIGWLGAAFDYLVALIEGDTIPYVPAPSPPDNSFVYALPEQTSFRIGILGDWGTGEPVAQSVINALVAQDLDLILHVGDIYYAGTPGEVQSNYIDMVNTARALNHTNVPVYNLAGNHDMYSGGAPFYNALPLVNQGAVFPNSPGTPVPVQQASFFSLQNSWLQLQGMDTGYYDSDLFDVGNDTTMLHTEEAAWHLNQMQQASEHGRSVFLFSHHQAWSTFLGIGTGTGTVGDREAIASMAMASYNVNLQAQLATAPANTVKAWFWGHEHVLEVYDQAAIANSTAVNVQTGTNGPLSALFPWVPYATCIGYSAFPVLLSDAPYDVVAPGISYNSNYVLGTSGAPGVEPVYNHGFCILEVAQSGPATATYYSLPGDGSSPTATVLTPPSSIY